MNPAGTVALFPSLSITKECTTPDIFVGEDAVYNIVVTNTSTPEDLISFEDVTVSDTLSGTLNPPGAFTLAPQASQNLTLTHTTVPADGASVSNVASASGDAVGPDASELGRTSPGTARRRRATSASARPRSRRARTSSPRCTSGTPSLTMLW